MLSRWIQVRLGFNDASSSMFIEEICADESKICENRNNFSLMKDVFGNYVI